MARTHDEGNAQRTRLEKLKRFEKYKADKIKMIEQEEKSKKNKPRPFFDELEASSEEKDPLDNFKGKYPGEAAGKFPPNYFTQQKMALTIPNYVEFILK